MSHSRHVAKLGTVHGGFGEKYIDVIDYGRQATGKRIRARACDLATCKSRNRVGTNKIDLGLGLVPKEIFVYFGDGLRCVFCEKDFTFWAVRGEVCVRIEFTPSARPNLQRNARNCLSGTPKGLATLEEG